MYFQSDRLQVHGQIYNSDFLKKIENLKTVWDKITKIFLEHIQNISRIQLEKYG